MSISDRKVAVLLARGFEDHELSEPVKALKDAGAQVMLVGLSEEDRSGVEGKHHSIVNADATIDGIDFRDFDMLIIPGGRGPAVLRQDDRVLELVRSFDRAGMPIAAICHGPQVLASADVLKGRTATSFFTVSREVKKAGAQFVNRPVVIDGNFITSRQVKDIPQFIEAIFDKLAEQERKTA